MKVIPTSFREESRDRYLTYALSVVSDRALPDVRDGLKPVQRRILYAMLKNLNLKPEGSHKKSATVVGEVLGSYHPHGDLACYEAMVRMAQDFSMRYMLVDGQGNFGSLDGDSAAAYRYTEAKLRQIAIDVIGEINEDTVRFIDNFDGSVKEPVVLPSKLPHLLLNGVTGIAVGMATNIPPHNIADTINTLLFLIDNPDTTNSKLAAKIKGPDFPTGCDIVSTSQELTEIYKTGRGSIKMRSTWKLEEGKRGKRFIVVDSIPFGVNKATMIEKIADAVISKKLPQVIDVRDESTEVIRVVIELASDANVDKALAYLYKNTTLEHNFNCNLTALVPNKKTVTCKPELLSLKEILAHYLEFREEVVERRLIFEKRKLEERLHILEGFVIIFDNIDKAIKIVRKSTGRSDAASKLRKAFKLTEIQSFAIVDLKIYQLSQTSIDDIEKEYKLKLKRVNQIIKILKSRKSILNLIKQDLEEVLAAHKDRRRSKIVKSAVTYEIDEKDYIVHEDVFAIITKDGWVKRIRQTNDLNTTRLREGDSILSSHAVSTKDTIYIFTSKGLYYSLNVTDFPSSSGYGTPIQKLLKFKDNERIIKSSVGFTKEVSEGQFNFNEKKDVVFITKNGLGYSANANFLVPTKKSGKIIIKVKKTDSLVDIVQINKKVSFFTLNGQGLTLKQSEILDRNVPAAGVKLIGLKKDDAVVAAYSWDRSHKITISMDNGKSKDIDLNTITLGKRTLKGTKVIPKNKIIDVKGKG